MSLCAPRWILGLTLLHCGLWASPRTLSAQEKDVKKRRGYRSASDGDRELKASENTAPSSLEGDLNWDEADFDVDEVAVEAPPIFEVHGRIAAILQAAFPDDQAERLNRLSPELSSAAITIFWDPLDWLRFLAEVEASGEGELEIDTLAAEIRPGPSWPRLRFGYTYVPFGIERFTYAPPRNPFINRPLAFRRIFPGSVQDFGVFVSGELSLPMLPRITYEGSLTSGLQGPDRRDRPEFELGETPLSGRNKDLQSSGRIGLTLYQNLDDPLRTPTTIEFGGSFLTGNYDRDERRRLSLQGLDIRVRIGDFSIQAEIISGSVDPVIPGPIRKRRGAYLWLVYRRSFGLEGLEAAHIGLRLDVIDPDHRRRDREDLFRASAVVGYEPAPGFLFKIQLDQVREFSRRHRDRFLVSLELGYSF